MIIKIRRVQLTDDKSFSVAVLDEQKWIPLKPLLAHYQSCKGQALAELEAVSEDVVLFLGSGEFVPQQLSVLLNRYRGVEYKVLNNSVDHKQR